MEILYACTFTKSTSADNHQHASMEQHFVWRQNSHNQDACSEAYLLANRTQQARRPLVWKAHEFERYVECADTLELAAGTTGWCVTAPQAKFKLRVGFASRVGGEGWWVEICGCSLGFRDCSSFCSDMSSSQDEA
ncbi:hypothetical protein WN943_025445 [Citrus x changshan-huyou]